jgi:glutamate synthase domain-containing protein 3
MTIIEADGVSVREINRSIRRLAAEGEREIVVRGPAARHNLAVAVLTEVAITIEGPVGYYCGGMSDGARIDIRGSAGWGVAECLRSGSVIVDGNAGNSAAASIRGGTVVVRGDAAARAGIAMKGGLLLIGGAAGHMTGFMMQRGTIVVCGDAAPGVADSMYEGIVYVGGTIAEPGSDTVVSDATAEESSEVWASLAQHGLKAPATFRKIISARKLWNYDRSERELWKTAF